MEVAMTRMSQNGQVVIPSEIRKDAKIKPSTQFIVFNQGGDIMLKQVKKESFKQLVEMIARSEEQIRQGKYTKADSKMTAKEMHNLLMK